MFSSYIFDLYGTLADIWTDEAPEAFWDAVARDSAAFGLRHTGKTFREAYLRLCADETEQRSAAEPDVPLPFVEPELKNVFCRMLLEQGFNDSDASKLAAMFRRLSTKRLAAMPHAAETLTALRARGAKTYLLSNAQSCFTLFELEAIGISDLFDGIILSSDAGMKKPYRGLFELLLARYGVDRSTAVMVGNDAVADIGGADAAGLKSRYIHTWQSGPRPLSLPESAIEIEDLSDLLL